MWLRLPLGLIIFRACCALVILGLGLATLSLPLLLVTLLWAGLLSDVLDGIVARRLGVDTDELRRLDSAIDVLFWLAVLMASVQLHPDAIVPWSFWLLGLVFGEGALYALNRWKFQRGSATHAYSAKLFGLCLLAGFTELFLTGMAGTAFTVMIIAGYVALVDVALIALVLPDWHRDVPSTWHAWRVRRAHDNWTP